MDKMVTVVTTLVYKCPVNDSFDRNKTVNKTATGIFTTDDLMDACQCSLSDALMSAAKEISRRQRFTVEMEDVDVVSHAQVIVEGKRV